LQLKDIHDFKSKHSALSIAKRNKIPLRWITESKESVLDDSLIISFALLMLNMIFPNSFLHYIAALILFLSLIHYKLVWPFCLIWKTLLQAIGKALSFSSLTIIYLLVVTPVGLIHKIKGKDQLKLNQFTKGNDSAFILIQHTFDASDMENTF